jgi:hypothetical protein
MLRTMMKSKLHRATGAGSHPAEVLPGSGLVRGDSLAR